MESNKGSFHGSTCFGRSHGHGFHWPPDIPNRLLLFGGITRDAYGFSLQKKANKFIAMESIIHWKPDPKTIFSTENHFFHYNIFHIHPSKRDGIFLFFIPSIPNDTISRIFSGPIREETYPKGRGELSPHQSVFFCGIFWNGIQRTNCWLLTPANRWIFLPVWSRDLSILQTARVVQNFFKSRDFCCSPRKGCLFCRCLDSELCWNYQILFLKFLQTNKRLNEWSDHLGIFFGGDFFTMNIQDIRYWMLQIPPGELSYPTWGKGKSSSKVPW